jgi:hypothetical protein
MPPQPASPQLQREWVLCAIAAAGSRFIPVPLADELVRDRAVRTAVARTWRAHGRSPAPQVLAVLSGDSTGTLTALRRSLKRLPLTLALYPWRKVRLVVTAVQGVSGDLLQVLLLARAVDRCLASGWFTGTDHDELVRQAHQVRQAHDLAVHGADLRTLQLALGSAFRQVAGLSQQARDFADRAFGRSTAEPDCAVPVSTTSPVPTTSDTQAGARLAAGADQVEAVLDQPEMQRILADLDARFDAALAALAPAHPPGVTPPSGQAG